MPTYGIYDGGTDAANFTKVGEREAANHDAALEALGDVATAGHVYAICGLPVEGVLRYGTPASTMVFRRAITETVTVTKVTSQTLRSFDAETERAAHSTGRPAYLGPNPSIYR